MADWSTGLEISRLRRLLRSMLPAPGLGRRGNEYLLRRSLSLVLSPSPIDGVRFTFDINLERPEGEVGFSPPPASGFSGGCVVVGCCSWSDLLLRWHTSTWPAVLGSTEDQVGVMILPTVASVPGAGMLAGW